MVRFLFVVEERERENNIFLLKKGNKEKAYLETVRRFFEVAFYKLQIDPNEVKKLISGETSELYLEFESLLDEIIEYGQEMSLQVVENVKNGTTDDQMMNSYVAQQYLSNPDISTRKLAVNAAIMLAAGVDTTSQMITMILTRLAENQDLQDQVALQINQISKGGDGGLVYEEKDQYSLLKACMREISRLTPVTGGFMREIAYPISIRGFFFFEIGREKMKREKKTDILRVSPQKIRFMKKENFGKISPFDLFLNFDYQVLISLKTHQLLVCHLWVCERNLVVRNFGKIGMSTTPIAGMK